MKRRAGSSDFAPGEIVALQIGNHPHWPALFLACLRRKNCRPATGANDEGSGARRCFADLPCVGIDDRSGSGADRAAGVVRRAIDWKGAPPVLLKLTSGTTAAPRAIRFRSAQLLADAGQICDTMGIASADLNFAVIPLSHSYGFSNLITPLLVRGVPMAVSSDRIPRAVLDDLARTEATVFPGMPVFYQAFAEMSEAPPLPKLRLCISAGAPLTRDVARAFREKFGRAIHSFYGASECGGICYDREGRSDVEGFVGRAMEGVEIEASRFRKRGDADSRPQRRGGRWLFSGTGAGQARRRLLFAPTTC